MTHTTLIRRTGREKKIDEVSHSLGYPTLEMSHPMRVLCLTCCVICVVICVNNIHGGLYKEH